MPEQIVPIQVPLTNGFIAGFANVRLEIAGLEFTGGFKSIKRNRKRKRDMVYSNNPDPIGKTLGENSYECSAEIYVAWLYNLIATLQNLGIGYADQQFTIFTSYEGKGLQTYTDQILGCTLDDIEGDDKQGTSALTRMINFNPTKILFGGIDDLEDPLVAPPQ